MKFGCAVMHDYDEYQNASEAQEKLEAWEAENAPVFYCEKRHAFVNRKTQRMLKDKDGEAEIKKQDRARDEFLNPEKYHDFDLNERD